MQPYTPAPLYHHFKFIQSLINDSLVYSIYIYKRLLTQTGVDNKEGLELRAMTTAQIAGSKSRNDPDDILIVHMCLLALALSPMQAESIVAPSLDC